MDKKVLYLAGWCFRCIDSAYVDYDWVNQTASWYIWGSKETANYNDVCSWLTDHREAVKIEYDPNIISLEQILDRFFQYIDPYDFDGQFADKWFQYTTAIYYQTQQEFDEIEKYIENKWFNKPLATQVVEFDNFYEAENYHQNYAENNPTRYNMYFKWSWREAYVKNNK
jgi:methionine-S-sulfoxide reductase